MLKGKKTLLIIGMLNILLFITGFLKITGNTQQDVIVNDILLLGAGGEVANHNLFQNVYPMERYKLSAQTGPLKSGVYSLKVKYETENDNFHLRCIGVADGNKYPVIYADEYDLKHQDTELLFNVWVNSNINDMEIRITHDEVDNEQENVSLYVASIELVRDYRCTVIRGLLQLLVFILMLDSLIAVIAHWDVIKQNYYVIFGLACVWLISSLSLFSNSQPAGLDIEFHYGRIIGLAEGLKAGVFPVKIQPGWINDYGYAVSIFYGDVLLYIPAILYALKIPLVHVYKLYILGINLGTVLIAYWSFKRLSSNKYIGVACSALYCLSINRILNVLLRAAVGEYSAFMFLPLLVVGVREIYTLDNEEHSANGWIFLCLGMTGVIQTHIQSFEMVCMLLLIVVVVMIKKTIRFKVLITFMKSALITVFLNLNFFIPFIDYMREDVNVFAERIPQPHGNQDLGLSIYELFSYETTAFGQAIPSTQSLVERIPESLGISMLCILILTVTVLVRYSDVCKHKKELILIMCMTGITLYLSTYYFPWNRLLAIPLIQNIALSIQFPWRFLGLSVLLLTYMACLIFGELKELLKREQMQFLLIGVCLICAVQGLKCTDLIVRQCDGNIKYDGSQLLDNRWTLISGEFLLRRTDVYKALEDKEIYGENVEIYEIDRNGTQIDISCRGGTDAYIDFPLFAYRHYKCVDKDTNEKFSVSKGENNRIHLMLPDNYEGRLKVYFSEPWYWRAAEVTTLFTLIWFMIYCLRTYIVFFKMENYNSKA